MIAQGNKCLIQNHSNKSIIAICLASQCQRKRVCCMKCQGEFHKDHGIDQFVDFDDLMKFISQKSQESNESSPKVTQALQELNNILKDMEVLTKLIRQEIQRLESANLQSFCKNLGNKYKIFTEQIGNQQWNDLAQEMLSNVELKQGEIVEKDSLITHFGKPYIHFMQEFSQTLTKMVKELKVQDQIIDPKQSVTDQKQNIIDPNTNIKDQNDQIIDPNPFSKLTERHVLQGHPEGIYRIDICEQRGLIVSGSYDRTVRLWNLQDNQLLKTYKDTSKVIDVVFSSQGKYIAYGGQSEIINLIDITDLKQNDNVTELKGHTNFISRLSFSNDQVYLISGSLDNTVRVWNVQSKVELFKLETDSYVYGIAMSRDNTLIVSHSQSSGIKIWDFKSQRLLCTHEGHLYGQGIIFSNDEKQLISCGSDGKIKFWSLEVLHQRKLLHIKEFQAAKRKIQKVLLTSDSRFIIFNCFEDGQVKVIDSNTGESVRLFEFNNKYTYLSEYLTQNFAITKQISMFAYGNYKDIVVWRRKQL